jgi:hypothetical protein
LINGCKIQNGLKTYSFVFFLAKLQFLSNFMASKGQKYGWMDFGGWSPDRLLHAGLNTGLMCNPGREVRIKGFWMEM